MSYDESEVIEELGFKLNDGSDEDEPLEPLEGADEFKFDEEPEEDPEDKFH
jgi:hypothetical protein